MDKTYYISEEIKPSLDEDLLIHYGVKGMKWRKRKKKKDDYNARKKYGYTHQGHISQVTSGKPRKKWSWGVSQVTGSAKKISIPGSNIGKGISDLIDKYEDWQKDTKWGKFLDKLDKPLVKPDIPSSASGINDSGYYWQAGPDGKWHKYKNGKRVG